MTNANLPSWMREDAQSPVGTLEMLVTAKWFAAEGIAALELSSAGEIDVPSWEPGAHIDVHLPNGQIRQYSLCGSPENHRSLRIAVLREPTGRGASKYLHDEARVGDVLHVSQPRNNFTLELSERYVFIAGGIGITPLLPMIRKADDADSQWSLLYGGRSLRSMAFVEELRNDRRSTIVPEDDMGLLDLEPLREARERTLIYCCGPEVLVKAVEAATAQWDEGALRVERFKPQENVPTDAGRTFTVRLDRSDAELVVSPGQSILEAVSQAGVFVPSSCQEGTCGSCETVVLDGEPEHRDSILTPTERASGDCMMICCSRARSQRLVLDL